LVRTGLLPIIYTHQVAGVPREAVLSVRSFRRSADGEVPDYCPGGLPNGKPDEGSRELMNRCTRGAGQSPLSVPWYYIAGFCDILPLLWSRSGRIWER
jgi:hypothetical protein